MPANFPSDVPVYKGLVPITSTADKIRGTGSVILSGKFDRADVASFYEKELEKAGWKQEANNDVGEITQQQYSKDDRKLIVQINPGDGSASTVMILYEKK